MIAADTAGIFLHPVKPGGSMMAPQGEAGDGGEDVVKLDKEEVAESKRRVSSQWASPEDDDPGGGSEGAGSRLQ